jgi:ABC-type antimicrobial peptide transport system permease subunit
LRPGDDASCNNLYRPAQPRIIGVTPQFVEYFDNPDNLAFPWQPTLADTDRERANPWQLLVSQANRQDDAIPAIVDMNTALYSLKPPALVGSVYQATFENGDTLDFRIVGWLENSILQGSLLISEADFEGSFPDVEGYRYFLARTPTGQAEQVSAVLEDRLGDQGFDAEFTNQVLQQLLAVQNTYLEAFQSLGALGLLLGTFGLATVQLRNVLERRGELALLRASGFRRRRLSQLVIWENMLLMAAGLAIGVFAALLAVLPHKLIGQAAIPSSLLGELAAMLGIVFVIGLLTSLIAVRATLRAPILSALREESL